MTISKKAMAAKETAAKKSGKGKTTSKTPTELPVAKNEVVAYFNWSAPKKDGSGYINCGKGLPLFQNPNYPHPRENDLIELAKMYGGSYETTMRVRITLANTEAKEITLDDYMVSAA